MIANVHVSWGNFITCLWNDVFQRTFRKWNATSRKRDHEDFLLGHWKNETIKLQALLANHDFRPMKNIPITEPLDYQQSECFGLFVFSFLLIGLFLLIKFISLFLFCSLEILETKSECTPRYDENWPTQDNPYLMFCFVLYLSFSRIPYCHKECFVIWKSDVFKTFITKCCKKNNVLKKKLSLG